MEVAWIDAAQLQVFGREAENIHPLLAKANNEPLTVLDVSDHDAAITQYEHRAIELRGTVSDAHETVAPGMRLVLDIASTAKGFRCLCAGNAFHDLYNRYQMSAAKEFVGRDVLALGTIVDYQGTPEIVVTDVESVDLLAKAATLPTTKP